MLEKSVLEELFASVAAGKCGFDHAAKQILEYQRFHCDVYRRYCDSVGTETDSYPYLPIEAFRLAAVIDGDPESAEEVFESSGTSTSTRSRHYVAARSVYNRSIARSYLAVFGLEQTVVLGHLPGYVETGRESSLAYMVELLCSRFGSGPSGVFVSDVGVLARAVNYCADSDIRLVLFGAAFGLLSLADSGAYQLPKGCIVVETGGMKTNRQEMDRTELHRRLAAGFGVTRSQIYSEYGMTELLSQAYAIGSEWYEAPPWVQVRIVDPTDPAVHLPDGESGAIAVIDLANVHSASSILTQDRGLADRSRFKVLGRLEGAEVRGCNFLLEGT